MNIRSLFVVEWSFSQRCFHVQEIEEALEQNLDVFRRHSGADYIPIGIYPTRDAARAACGEFRKWLPRPEDELQQKN
jgi:hypothetical protein